MKILIWVLAGIVALLWSGTLTVMALAAGWAADVLQSGQAIEWARDAASLPVPRWIALWFDPDVVRALQDAALWAVDTLHGLLPFMESALNWLVPVVWVVWALGMLAVLGFAGGLHLLVRTASRSARTRTA